MGDRTTLYLNYAACDKKAVEKELGEPSYEEPEEEGIVFAQFDEVNWGGQEELEAISKAGVPFWGHHESGYEYPLSHLAGIGRKSYEFCGGACDDSLCVEFSLETGAVMQIASAKRFRGRWLRAKAAVSKRAKGKVLNHERHDRGAGDGMP